MIPGLSAAASLKVELKVAICLRFTVLETLKVIFKLRSGMLQSSLDCAAVGMLWHFRYCINSDL